MRSSGQRDDAPNSVPNPVPDRPEPLVVRATTAGPVSAARSRPPSPRSAPVRLLRPAVAALSVVLIGTCGVTIAAHGATPGDLLWPLTSVLYTEKASSVQAARTVAELHARAQRALDEGHRADAAIAVAVAGEQIRTVRDDEGRDRLQSRQRDLVLALDTAALPPVLTSPSATRPDASDPESDPTDPAPDPSDAAQASSSPAPDPEIVRSAPMAR